MPRPTQAPSRQGTTPSVTPSPQPPPSASSSASPAPSPSPSPTPAAEPADSDYEVVRVNSNLIVVPVSITDAKGQAVEGLKASDFRLEEEGRQQEITQIGDPEQVPLEMAILLDVSGSVKGRFAFEKQAAAQFIKSILKPDDRAIIYAIDSTPRLIQPRAGAEQVIAKLQAIEPTDSPTAFYDTVVDAARYLMRSAPRQHRRVILVISDGEDTFSENVRKISDTLTVVQRADAVFYAINPSGQALQLNMLATHGQQEMQMLATATGGAAFVPNAEENLEAIFRQIAAELRSQYLLGYYAKSEAASGTFLHIKVQVPRRSNLRIRARQGYYMSGK